ncbi:unnamed protein product [Diabrotica balteata]|uniref:Sushi domain-containing protein n=1 Tax=Diabrotica balteata TaxID=107213 RepID=A0A9N9T381_DIABA|nr:unnamed protein product [Diabrotica balteata]
MSSTDTADEVAKISLSPPRKPTKKSHLDVKTKEIILNIYKCEIEENPTLAIDESIIRVAHKSGLSTATLDSFSNSTSFTIRKRRQNSLKCTLPPQLENGRWVVTEADVNPGDQVDVNTIIRLECHKGYQLYPNNSLLLCDSSWDETTFPMCQKKCPPFYSTTTTTLTCKDIQNGAVPCDKAVDGTSLTYTCSAYYEILPGGRNTLYCNDGTWNFPKPICEPTAHCVTDNYGRALNETQFQVAAGKVYNAYEDKRDIYAQYRKILQVMLIDDIEGETRRYTADVAYHYRRAFQIRHNCSASM